jgi:hypothetical protein
MEEQLDIFGAKSGPLEKNLPKHKLQTTEFNSDHAGFLVIPWEKGIVYLALPNHRVSPPLMISANDFRKTNWSKKKPVLSWMRFISCTARILK